MDENRLFALRLMALVKLYAVNTPNGLVMLGHDNKITFSSWAIAFYPDRLAIELVNRERVVTATLKTINDPILTNYVLDALLVHLKIVVAGDGVNDDLQTEWRVYLGI